MKTSSAVGPSASRDPIIVQSAIESPFEQVILCQINIFSHQLTQNMTTDFVRFTKKICTNCSEIQNLQNQLLYFGLIGDKICLSDKE